MTEPQVTELSNDDRAKVLYDAVKGRLNAQCDGEFEIAHAGVKAQVAVKSGTNNVSRQYVRVTFVGPLVTNSEDVLGTANRLHNLATAAGLEADTKVRNGACIELVVLL